MKAAVSGASGFVGRRLLQALAASGDEAVPLVRTAGAVPGAIAIGDLSADGPINLPRMDALVHLAARVHVMHERASDPLEAYRRANVHGTRRMLEAARRAGAARFVFVSTIKVLGEETPPDRPFGQDAPPNPVDPYAVSKLEAENAVIEFCERHAMTWSIVRPVLVHGSGVGGNFVQLIRLVDSQVPLPFGAIDNRRSLLSVDNLAAFLAAALYHPYLSGRIVNLADEPAHSTPSMIRSLAAALGRRARLFPVPARALELAAALVGRGAAVQRLTRSLHVDTSQLVREMPWQPPVSWEQAFQETVADAVRRR